MCVFTISSQAKLCTLQGQLRCLYTLYILSTCGGPTHNLKVVTRQLQAHTHQLHLHNQQTTSMHQKGKQLFGPLYVIYCRSTSKTNPLLEEPRNARHSFLIPMHTQSARHSLGRRTPPRRPDHPSRCSSFLQTPPFSNPKTAPSSCCAQDHRTTTCFLFLFHAQKPLFWPHQALQGMTSHAVRTAPARLHGLWRNKTLPLPTRIRTLMPPAATAFAVIASRFQHCAAEHYFAVADSKQTHLLMMRHVSQACEQSHTLQPTAVVH